MSEGNVQPNSERRRHRSSGVTLRRRHGQLVRTLLERRGESQPGFDVAAALELYLDRFPTREAQLVLLKSWLYTAERGELSTQTDYSEAISRAIEAMTAAADPVTAITSLQVT